MTRNPASLLLKALLSVALLFVPGLAGAVTITSVLVNGQGAGLVGQTATITGSGFTISEGNPSSVVISVTFNGVAAAGNVNSYGSLTATIPVGATTGIVRVTVQGGTFAESDEVFVVGTQPYIRRFSPGAGLVGNSVTIYGENFNLGFNGASSVTGVQFGNHIVKII